MSLFGSSKNGFGFKQSDLDVCMTINGHETAEVRLPREHTCAVSMWLAPSSLAELRGIWNVRGIPHAVHQEAQPLASALTFLEGV